jgi:hypothetical protein
MEYLHYDLGHRSSGEVVEVTLRGNAANVLLLDSSNFNNFKAGRRHTFHGGHATRSPVRLTVPRSGRWYVVVHMGGYQGRVNASVQVLPGALPALRQQAPNLASIMSSAAEYEVPAVDESVIPATTGEYDVFISHATEDKDEIVRPLAVALQARGVGVWYDEFELRIGDSLRKKIDAGLSRSRFGVVVLSHPFFSKNWPQYELDGLVTREIAGEQQIILPLWHRISKDEVISYSPSLADKVALQTAVYSVEEIADQIVEVILPKAA